MEQYDHVRDKHHVFKTANVAPKSREGGPLLEKASWNIAILERVITHSG